MRKTNIQIAVELDEANTPTKIGWSASDKPSDAPDQTNAFSLSIWDSTQNSTLHIGLWTPELMVGEMKKFTIQAMAALANQLRSATGDHESAKDIETLLDTLSERFLVQERNQEL
jgi:gliding motility-associated protein GldC